MDRVQVAHVIELHVGDPSGLFAPFDASSLRARHLDHEVEQFIVHRAQETTSACYALAVQHPNRSPRFDAIALSDAIRKHFAHRSEEELRRLTAQIREARRDLLIGFVFLLLCAALALVAWKLLPAPLGLFVEQGLLIIGWVALWRPIDLFLYELRPLRSRRALYDTLARMEVSFSSIP